MKQFSLFITGLVFLFSALLFSGCVMVQSDPPGEIYSERQCYYTPEGVYHCKMCYGTACARDRYADRVCYLDADSLVICEIYPQSVEWHMYVNTYPYPPPPPPPHRRPPPRHFRGRDFR